ncbi:MAG: TonB-dependent receptor plug domain-containing protein [Syntrophaceae bacterium]|nr:TonB-dependent receptor plug domain-containing protein [Syntrophaceae bacterium]
MMSRKIVPILLLLSLLILPVWSFADDPAPSVPQKGRESGAAEKAAPAEARQAVHRLEAVVVTAGRPANPTTPVTTRYGTQHNVVTEEQIREQSGRDFQSALRDVPGVMFQSKNLMGSQTSHSLYIRGRGASHPSSDFAVLYDGVPRFGALFGQVLGDGMAPATIGSIEIFKSPQPSEFGSGYASVNVIPRQMKEEGREAVFDAGGGTFKTFSQSLSAGVRKGPYDLYVSQSWASTDGHREHSRAQQQSYYANAGYELGGHWNVRFLANYVGGQTLAPRPETRPTAINGVSWPMAERFDTGSFLSTLTLNNRYAVAQGCLKAYVNETDFDLLQELKNGVRYAGGSGGVWSRQKALLYGVRLKERLALWPGGEIAAGVDWDVADMKNTARTYSGLAVPGVNGGKAERIWDYPRTVVLSPYAAISHLFGTPEGFHAIPSAGYRYLHHNEFQSASSWQAGLVAGWARTDLNIHYARGVNYPSPIVLMNMVLTDAPAAGGETFWSRIKPETVDHYEIGLTHAWPQKATVGATLFYDRGRDRYQAYLFGPVPVSFNDPIGKYEIRGVELTGTVTPAKRLEIFAALTLMDAQATGGDGIERDHLPYTPGCQLQAGFHWSFWERFRLRMDMQYLQDVYAGTNLRSGSFNFGPLTDINKLEDFVLVNGRLGYVFEYRPLQIGEGEVYAAINNLFNRHYEYAKGYSMPGITVFAGLTLKFL